ncbi:glutamate 5-kinase [Colwellia sp. MT41]|uniref:Glutamate 5-kinase n=1 Tax=Colwellia marinimaniae TaxID=1513592 RepID=A0ABQ0MW38_9GAMM|nr:MULTISPECIES: glutamate 5-kinase [Colwellia]ALO36286.1 glutamate 5-kinase [Colwellia sp. MT41]GAW96590.1 glutamate 5-kinase [Colwellia marinimaniae]
MNFHRAVIKVGSALVAPTSDGCSGQYILAIAQFITKCQQQGKEIILVSSGGVAAGRALIHHGSPKLSVATKKAMASVGQMQMMANWQRFFDSPCSQILVTQEDLTDRKRFVSIQETIKIQLANGILPIVNENDTVTTKDLTIGDNDNLAALVAQVCEADSLFILSDIDGVFTKDPKIHDDAVLIPNIDKITDEIYAMAGTSRNHLATGGMKTKIQAAEKAVEHGINTYIINGTKSEVFSSLLAKVNPGTRFAADKDIIRAKKHWLKHTLKSQGIISLDPGAVNALVNKGASLLPAGIKSVTKEFKAGDAVELIDAQNNAVIAKGISLYSYHDLKRIMGKHSNDISTILGHDQGDVVVHRDDMVIL